jgi:hypothetical protein
MNCKLPVIYSTIGTGIASRAKFSIVDDIILSETL